MSELHLLDILCRTARVLYLRPESFSYSAEAALLDLCRMETNKFPLSQWQDSVRYLTGIEKDFASIEEIKAFLRNEVKP
mgnify:CR=1 FL=1